VSRKLVFYSRTQQRCLFSLLVLTRATTCTK